MKQTKTLTVNSLFTEAALVSMRLVKLTSRRALSDCELKTVQILVNGTLLPSKVQMHSSNEVLLYLEEPYPFGQVTLAGVPGQFCPVLPKEVVRTKEFDDLFYYSGSDLGVCYKQKQSTFVIWSPTAVKVELIIYKQWFDEKGTIISFDRETSGVWRSHLDGDWQGFWYQYIVTNPGTDPVRIVDPYAAFLSINGQKAMIGRLILKGDDTHKLKPLKKEQSVIYEVHIRDFTSAASSGVVQKGTFSGLLERGTRNRQGLTTGLDYMKELGITHVQLMPVQEFSTVDESNALETYNWGYDTTHFFGIEGSYSTNPYSGYKRVEELHELIKGFHNEGIRVILDVVYNHQYIWEDSAIEQLVPGYFFRYKTNGNMSNGTGVGNDLATERSMVRKMIVDSVTYLLTTFNVDGLRFDLMGIIDLETMKEISDLTDKMNKDILLLGEGWRMDTAYPDHQLAITEQANELLHVSFFEDRFRDLLTGHLFSHQSGGFTLTGTDPSAMKDAICGNPSRFNHPAQAIHYAEAHDNLTIWDKFSHQQAESGTEGTERRHILVTSMILLSQGIPFLHAGQEWCRTKLGVENSYCTPDWINGLDWDRRTAYDNYAQYVKGIIQIRKAYSIFSLPTYHEIHKRINWLICESDFLLYELNYGLSGHQGIQKILIAHNGTEHNRSFFCKVQGIWQVCVDEKAASLVPLYSLRGEELTVSPLSTMVCLQ
ncbi:type I pullulanase [Alkalicoccobacillus murimartini]|uniref:Pullulanase n=1 Tax=Alkalicoccobacillus murimartini TaxID=171685 RepID=A0ABT9YL15_9BACI|nr:type I pullulanase [Alkalicoccobacillus murimartini]MDQ0208171.1 pullulanase [Alkalicoccobacillus murimartini]